ncbi:MAG: Holliday junction resolvase RuvX [Candidatus Aminicenantales bacterium]
MRILGIDYGDRHLGLALSDKLQLTAQPLGTYTLKARMEENQKYFQELVVRHEVAEIVVGLPLRMNGSAGTRVQKTKEFVRWLEHTLKLPVILWDERLSTQQALGLIREQKVKPKNKKSIEDQISATIILLGYLESKGANAQAS